MTTLWRRLRLPVLAILLIFGALLVLRFVQQMQRDDPPETNSTQNVRYIVSLELYCEYEIDTQPGNRERCAVWAQDALSTAVPCLERWDSITQVDAFRRCLTDHGL